MPHWAMCTTLSGEGVRVPNGFALTAGLYRGALTAANAWPRHSKLLEGLGDDDVQRLAVAAAEARSIVHAATGTDGMRALTAEQYHRFEGEYGSNVALAVRSSATAEDLPTASFAGQPDQSDLAASGVVFTLDRSSSRISHERGGQPLSHVFPVLEGHG